MSKQEFIDRLRAALNGRISPNLVIENVNYYEDYINTQIRMGQTEDEVLKKLGDPRLIARTIIETSGQGNDKGYQKAGYQDTGYQNAGYQGEGYRDTGYQNQGASAGRYTSQGNMNQKTFHLPGWLWVIVAVLVITLVIGVVGSVLSILAPVILPILVVVFLIKLFRDWLN